MRDRGKARETLQACLKNGNFMAGFLILLSVFLIAALKLYMDKNIRNLLKILKREDA